MIPQFRLTNWGPRDEWADQVFVGSGGDGDERPAPLVFFDGLEGGEPSAGRLVGADDVLEDTVDFDRRSCFARCFIS